MTDLTHQPMIDAGLAFDWSKLPPLANSVSDYDPSSKVIRLIRSGKELKGVSSLKSAKEFWAGGVNDKYLEDLCELTQLEFLHISNLTAKTLEPLRNLRHLSRLYIRNATKISDLEWLTTHTQLKILSLENLPKVSSFDPLSRLTQLTALALNSGLWKDWRVESLTPLKELQLLNVLQLVGVRPSDGLLEPLTSLRQLRILACASYFPAHEFHKLKAANPELEYSWFETLKGDA